MNPSRPCTGRSSLTKRDGKLIGTHYEYLFGGLASRPEWLSQGEEYWRRDQGEIEDTSFDSLRLVQSWLPASVVPNVTIRGVLDEYRWLVEARLVESDRGNLLFNIYRSGYDWEVEVMPREIRPRRSPCLRMAAQIDLSKESAAEKSRTCSACLLTIGNRRQCL